MLRANARAGRGSSPAWTARARSPSALWAGRRELLARRGTGGLPVSFGGGPRGSGAEPAAQSSSVRAYFLPVGEFEPQHRTEFPFPLLIRATSTKLSQGGKAFARAGSPNGRRPARHAARARCLRAVVCGPGGDGLVCRTCPTDGDEAQRAPKQRLAPERCGRRDPPPGPGARCLPGPNGERVGHFSSIFLTVCKPA